MKNKIIIFVVVLAVMLSLFTVSAFALDETYYGEYLFNEVLYLPNYNITYTLDFMCNGIGYTGIHVSYRGGDYYYVSYIRPNANTGNDEHIDVYHDGWVDEVYRSINIYRISDDQSTVQWLNDNEYIVPVEEYYGWYYDIRDLLISTIFYDGEVPPEAEFGLSLISLILCVGAILLPVLMVFGLFLWILKRM